MTPSIHSERATPADPLLGAVHACRRCAGQFAHTPRPVLQFDPRARLLIVGQAPGRRVHDTGIPFNDPSGERLREWLGIDRSVFYDASRVALLPMAFCWPGSANGADLPPPPVCAASWRSQLLAQLPRIELTVLLGRYALGWHLGVARSTAVAEVVAAWRDHAPALFVLPHPSPRNRHWIASRPWIETELVPALRHRVQALLAGD